MDQSLYSSTTLSMSSLATDIFPLIAPIRPNWSPSNTHLQQFTGGITNIIFGLFDNSNQSEALIIKIFGLNTEEFIDRDAEVKIICALSEYKLAQPVLLRFNNGIIYKFTSGEICRRDDIRNMPIVSLIARQMAKLHLLTIKDINQKPCLVPLMRKFLTLVDHDIDRPQDFMFLSSEVDWIEQDMLPRLIPNPQYGIDLVLCHNDVLCKNVLYNSLSNSISFIDFEYSAINFTLFDIANHFVEYAGVDHIDFDRYPTRDEQCRWLKIYFEARSLKFDDHKEICHLIDQFSALSHFCYGLWGLVQVCFGKLDYDYASYARR